jgi:hypothetical protein
MESRKSSGGVYAPFECIIAEFRDFVPNRPYEKPKIVKGPFFIMARSAEEARELAIPQIPDHLFKAGTNRVFVREFLDDSLKRYGTNCNSGQIDQHETTSQTP